MTKEITKASILQEIQDKFGLRELTPERFVFDETVTPIYDIGQHVKNWKIERYRFDVSAATLYFPISAPKTEQWKIRRLVFVHETGANFDVDQILHYKIGATTDIDYIFYDTTSPITSGTVKLFEFPQDIPFGASDTLGVNISNFVGGGYCAVHVLKEVETIR